MTQRAETLPALRPCMWCKGAFAPVDGPTHPYMESTPGCWAAFGRVLVREYSDPGSFEVHRLTVDAYAVQHSGTPSRRSIQSVGVHLVRLCLLLERGLPPAQANEAMRSAARLKAAYHWLEPPAFLGQVTVADVEATVGIDEHKTLVRTWAAQTWAAWSPHHAIVRAWADAT